MKISYRAAYTLLENHYERRSLNLIIEKNVRDDIFKASIQFAKQIEDYRYLAVMVTNREKLDNLFVLFINNSKHSHPIILEKDKDLSLLEFAILYTHSHIHISEFNTVVEAQAGNKKLDEKEQLKIFKNMVKLLSE